MFCIVDREKNFAIVKSGFKTSSKANDWAKKNLPRDDVKLWGAKWTGWEYKRYFVKMR